MNEYEKFLAEAKAKLARKAEKLAKKKLSSSSEEASPGTSSGVFAPKASVVDKRLSLDEVKEVYQQTQLTPSRSFYFFKPDRPLLYASHISVDGGSATPLGALCIFRAAPFLAEPSEEWSGPQIGSFLGLAGSYVLGFRSGFDGNAPGHPRCSDIFHQGYNDGVEIFNLLLEDGLIENIKHEPVRMSDEQLLEFYRVAGKRSSYQNLLLHMKSRG